jgi:hypothetical protein
LAHLLIEFNFEINNIGISSSVSSGSNLYIYAY